MKKAVKRILHIVGIVILFAIVAVIALFAISCGINSNKESNYYKYATPYGEIEKKYTPMGELMFRMMSTNRTTHTKNMKYTIRPK